MPGPLPYHAKSRTYAATDPTRDYAWGSALAVGDFNNDGSGDLIIGARESFADTVRAGAMYVLQGEASALPPAANAERHHQSTHTSR